VHGSIDLASAGGEGFAVWSECDASKHFRRELPFPNQMTISRAQNI
jgi:hypothetical protein